MDSNSRLTMKRSVFICVLCFFTTLAAFPQFTIHIDTAKFVSQSGVNRGKIFELTTFGNQDSVKINGITFYTSLAGTESDPVWLSDSSQYYTKTQSNTLFLTPSGVSNISGAKTFNDGKLILRGTGDATTIVKTLAGGLPDQTYTISLPSGSGTVALTSEVSKISRYSAYSSGNNNVEVLADGVGITASIANGNELTFTIPSGIKIISAKIRIGTGFSTLKVFLGTTDMTNGYAGDRWMPITQAWREDTGQQLMGLTTVMDLFRFDKLTINGLISTTPNLIRVSF